MVRGTKGRETPVEVSQTREPSEFCKGASDNLSEVRQLHHCRISGSSFCALDIMEKSIPFVTAPSSERDYVYNQVSNFSG